jgi:hypothetical protein
MRMIRPFSALVAAVAALALASCTDAGPGESGLPTDAGEGLYPSITVSTSRGATQAELSLRQVPGGLTFGSYQGEVVFDPQLLELQSVDLPAGVEGAANQSSPGHVRFVGSALDGTAGTPLLSLRFAAKGAVTASAFRVTFEEVTDGDFNDLTPKVKPDLIFQSR